MWECIQLEDNLPDDLKKINHLFFNQISDFGLDQRSEYSEYSELAAGRTTRLVISVVLDLRYFRLA